MSVKHYALVENEATSLHIGGGCGEVHEGGPERIEICELCLEPAALAGFPVESVEAKKAESKAKAPEKAEESTGTKTEGEAESEPETGSAEEEPKPETKPKRTIRGRAKKA